MSRALPAGPLRLAVIGAGTHGARYLRHARADVAGLAPVVLCRRDREAGARLAAEIGCRHEPDALAAIHDPDVDACVIATPPSSHLALAREVLAAGKPLLLEKPMTGTLAEARELVRLDRAAAAPPLMLAQTLRWNAAVLKARALWPRLGRVHLIRLAQRLAPTTLGWQRDPAQSMGGSVLLTGVHLFDLVRFLSGREFVEVDSRQRQVLHPSLEDGFLARAVLDDGAWASLEVSKFTDSRAGWLEAVGQDGQLHADYQQGGVTLRQGRDATFHAAEAAVPVLPHLLADWLARLRAGEPPAVGALDGLRTLEVVEACYRSHRERRAVLVDQIRGEVGP